MKHNNGGSQILQTQGAIALITKLLNSTRFWLIGSIKAFSLIIKLWWLGGGTAIKGLFAVVCDENAWYQRMMTKSKTWELSSVSLTWEPQHPFSDWNENPKYPVQPHGEYMRTLWCQQWEPGWRDSN
jgi:hypothetical protein